MPSPSRALPRALRLLAATLLLVSVQTSAEDSVQNIFCASEGNEVTQAKIVTYLASKEVRHSLVICTYFACSAKHEPHHHRVTMEFSSVVLGCQVTML